MPVIEQMKVLFKPETDVKAALRPVLNMMFGQAIKAVSDTFTDEDEIVQYNYELIYGMIRSVLSDK